MGHWGLFRVVWQLAGNQGHGSQTWFPWGCSKGPSIGIQGYSWGVKGGSRGQGVSTQKVLGNRKVQGPGGQSAQG